jgi:hypothetical protein
MGMTMAAVRSTPPGCAAPAVVQGLALVAQEKFGRRGIGLKIFETSGTTAGQQTAFSPARSRRLSGGRRIHRAKSRIALFL